jgi:hypothetical protein
VFAGASFTAVIAMPRVADPGVLMPSVAVKVIVREAVGSSLLFAYVTERSAV